MTVNSKTHIPQGQPVPRDHSQGDHVIAALILAAGKGTRMKSARPKVLHPVLGRPMLDWVIGTAQKAGATDVTVVLSPEIKPFEAFMSTHDNLRVAVQNHQRGTGDAVASAAAAFSGAKVPPWAETALRAGAVSNAEWVLICAGDTPAMNPQTIRDFIQATLNSKKRLAVLGMRVTEPKGYGRLVRSADGGLLKIVEERDADAAIKAITVCNTGVIFARIEWLFDLLGQITPNNAQNEYYLTDIFAIAASRGESAFVFETSAADEFAGVNDRSQLDALERSMLRRRAQEFMSHGVTIHLPDTVYIEADVVIEADTRIFPGACLKGKTRISRNCMIGAGAVLMDAVIGAGCDIDAHAVLTRTKVSAGTHVLAQSHYADTDL
jgi:bifunctional UDP-N-acetylglucosamine pyrophosphorylase/glucosamine-1-phosphate N-acetyltransferase